MVEDSTNQIALPSHTLTILDKLVSQTSLSRFDLFNVLVISIGSECGFYDADLEIEVNKYPGYPFNNFDKNFINDCANLFTYKPDKNFFNFIFKFINCPAAKVFLTCIFSSDIVIVTAKNLKNGAPVMSGFSIAVSLSRYVPFDFNNDFPHKTFRKLKEFSKNLKNEIFLPCRCQIYQSINRMNPSLIGIPIEVLDKIFLFLNSQDKNNFKSALR